MENILRDIHKFPKWRGQLVFPISMSRISNAQDANHYFKTYIPHLNPSKVTEPKFGITFRYGDGLYMRTNETELDNKNRYISLINSHMRACKNLIQKPYWVIEEGKVHSYYIPNAFGFSSWDQAVLLSEIDVVKLLTELRKIYDNDKTFQKYMQEDAMRDGVSLTNNQILFYLEEHLLMELVSRGKIIFPNTYASHPTRVLICYPGKAVKHHMYMIQKNFFWLNRPENPYQNCFYDLEGHILYDANKINLEEYKY